MAELIVSDVVERVLEHLGEHGDEVLIASCFGGRKKLRKVEQNLRKLQAVLPDAERLRDDDEENEAAIKAWLKSLKHILYQMEDQLEELYIAEKEMEQSPGGKLKKPLLNLVSKTSHLCIVTRQVAQQVRPLVRDLANISLETCMQNYGLIEEQPQHEKVDDVPRSICEGIENPFVLPDMALFCGRSEEKRDILHLLFNLPSQFIYITGMDGVGKTSLVRAVFDDPDVVISFEVRSWVSHSVDLDDTEESLLRQILSPIIGEENCRGLKLVELESWLRRVVTDKKCLLVTDNIGFKTRFKSLHLWRTIAKPESKVIYIYRPGRTGEALQQIAPHAICPLESLPLEDSWELFKALAFKRGHEMKTPSFMVNIGRKIVETCSGIPLLIRIMAATLYAKYTEQEWQHFYDTYDEKLKKVKGDIESLFSLILKLAYDQLTPQLKQCFAYCSLFPSDHSFRKADMTYLWRAQGFIDKNHNPLKKELDHDYFMELLRRNFFHDPIKNETGEVTSCKMHLIVHDMAREMARNECLTVCEEIKDFNSIRHLSFIVDSSWEAPAQLFTAKKLRSLLLFSREKDKSVALLNVEELFSSLRCLHVVDLGRLDSDSLPDTIGKLKHLRYFKVSGSLEYLPEAITRLVYLQCLDFQACHEIRKIPVSLDLQRVRLLHSAKHQQFVVNDDDGLDVLASNIVQKLEIYFERCRPGRIISEAMSVDLTSRKVNDLVLEWSSLYEPEEEDQENLILEKLLLPQSVKSLSVRFWKGTEFSMWEIYHSHTLPHLYNLVSIEIEGCNKCKHLPPFSRLPSLKYLRLSDLKALEYIEKSSNIDANNYFPALENLKLEDLPMLKQWVKDDGTNHPSHLISFPHLLKLKIYLCPALILMPQGPRLELLSVEEIDRKLLQYLLQGIYESTASNSNSSQPLSTTFKELQIVSLGELHDLSLYLPPQDSLRIKRCEKLVKLTTAISPIFPTRLEVYSCGRLTSITGALQHLKYLKIWGCEELVLWNTNYNGGGDTIYSRSMSLSTNYATLEVGQGLKQLHSLSVGNISLLPRWSYITTLQQLKIFQLSDLENLPQWIGHLTQLNLLEIVGCPKLRGISISTVANEPSSTLIIRIEQCQELLSITTKSRITFKLLEVRGCSKVKVIHGEELIIQDLVVEDCDELRLWGNETRESASSDKIYIKSLQSLTLRNISKLKSFRRGLVGLTELEELKIYHLPNLKILSLWIGLLTKLYFLEIIDCPKLQEIRTADEEEVQGTLITQPNSLILTIRQCGKLRDILGEDLRIQKLIVEDCDELNMWDDNNKLWCSSLSVRNNLQLLTLRNIMQVKSLSIDLACFPILQELSFSQLPNLQALELWVGHITKGLGLRIHDCPKLEKMSMNTNSTVDSCHGGILSMDIRRCGRMKDIELYSRRLTITHLAIDTCDELQLWADHQVESTSRSTSYIPSPSNMSATSTIWQCFRFLLWLNLEKLSKLESLPNGFRCAEILEELRLYELANLRALPEWIDELSHLRMVTIIRCPKLTILPDSLRYLSSLQLLMIEGANPELLRKCEKPNGEDWPKIQHIAQVGIW